jgi:hypothetical protein
MTWPCTQGQKRVLPRQVWGVLRAPEDRVFVWCVCGRCYLVVAHAFGFCGLCCLDGAVRCDPHRRLPVFGSCGPVAA